MTCCGCVCTCSAPHIQPPCTWNTITLHQCKPKLTMIYHPDGCVYILPFSVLLSDCMYCILPSLLCTVAEQRERSELSGPIIAVYSRFYIYVSVCTCIAQDRAHLTQVLSRRPIVHCPSEHHFEESPIR